MIGIRRLLVAGFAVLFMSTIGSAMAISKPRVEYAVCTGNAKVCGNLGFQRHYALNEARQFVNQSSSPQSYDLFFQVDATSSVTHFKLHFYQKGQPVEGAGGKVVSYYRTAELLSEKPIEGELKHRINRLLMSGTKTQRFIMRNLPYASNKDIIDMEDFCGIPATEHSPSIMLSQCSNALLTYLWPDVESVQIIEGLLGEDFEGKVTANELFIYPDMTLGSKVRYLSSPLLTAPAGNVFHLATKTGYRLTVVATDLGFIKSTSFTIPPHDLPIPLKEDGDIDFDKLTKKAEQGTYSFTIDNARFIQLVATRTGLRQWQELADKLLRGFNCYHCRVTAGEPN
ncbi:hypothetical protein [Psychrobium sp. 1_MG-2023]|uniref:hypothetical protein n=1 Tax=Psychrobium sp. 1_MG-2023 TaxID=3062624 RepID=UPI000C322670|nr:hypothetical protein [Psychrobium sp. 1_MG-2023]MDP2559615.1 hypothetical protein [Psychrobium sp. 1_MG-2023]PKF59449.1 hypothetical protein CW748_01365 [Alteromonadales bacterium alter-6D02]